MCAAMSLNNNLGSRSMSKRDVRYFDMPSGEKSVKISIGGEDVKVPFLDNTSNGGQPKADMKILGVRLDHVSPTAQFFICTFGIFFFYLIYGFFQELIFRLEGFKPFGMYLTLVQFAWYAAFSFTERTISGNKERKIPMKNYLLIGALTVGTMGFSNSSVGYLNYPTQVIFKCCKLIPVLIMGIFIQGKKYSLIDFIACLCMSVGLIFFTLADSSVSPTFNMFGVLLISLALCSDALIGNVQEKTMKQHGASNSEMVFYSYGVGFFIILAFEVLSGQLWSAFTFCIDYPVETYGYAFLFSLSGYLGVNFVLTLIKTSGALLAVTVTTCRKAVTIILSFILFAKPFTITYVWSGMIVVFGIYLNVYSKNKAQIDEKMRSLYERYILQRRRPVAPLDLERIV